MNDPWKGLSDAEMDQILKLPRVEKSRVYAMAEAWFASHRDQFAETHPGKWLVINAHDLTYIVGDTYIAADKAYTKQCGLPREGRPMFIMHLPR